MRSLACDLCPKQCRIAPGESGECRIRVHLNGRLLAVTFGRPAAVHVDPVEKKPLFHFLPGTNALSLATVGCNLHCRFCQNWDLSQANPEDVPAYVLEPDRIPAIAVKEHCHSVAYTYSDPVVYYEYALETSERIREASLRNVLVTAAYLNPDPFRRLCRVTDAANIDLKFFSDDLYRRIAGGSLGPVLTALEIAKEEGVWVEVTNLLVPTLNDDPADVRRLVRWLVRHLGADTPLHFSRFFPRYRMTNLPPTPAGTLARAREVAREEGLRYVYAGNVGTGEIPGSSDTWCPACKARVIRRVGYDVFPDGLEGGRCRKCGAAIPGVFR